MSLMEAAQLAGWPTPEAHARGEHPRWTKTRNGKQSVEPNLAGVAVLAGWATPKAQNTNGSGPSRIGNKADLQTLAGWASPGATDHKGSSKPGQRVGQLSEHALLAGATTDLSTASTEKPGALNPALARWLMGFPPAWCDCAVMAMPSCRPLRRRS
jgi:hypothetical protein